MLNMQDLFRLSSVVLLVFCHQCTAYPNPNNNSRRSNSSTYNTHYPRQNNGYGNYNYYNSYNPYRNYYNNGYGNYNYYNRNYYGYGQYQNYNPYYYYNRAPYVPQPAPVATNSYNPMGVPGLQYAKGGGYVDSFVGRLWLFCDGISGCGHGRG
uniref:Uncharacterized protein n=1 Tax=Steinernema glaseri TaxID=37863 RepID=A0A1I8ARC4_9BILA